MLIVLTYDADRSMNPKWFCVNGEKSQETLEITVLQRFTGENNCYCHFLVVGQKMICKLGKLYGPRSVHNLSFKRHLAKL